MAMKTIRCNLCLSPYRTEIISAHKQGVPIGKLYEKYAPLMGYKAKKKSLYIMIFRHIKEQHNPDAIYVPPPEGSVGKAGPATIENFGKRMLELGMSKIETMNPNNVQLKDVIASQKLVLDSKKLKLAENAFELMLGKMFAPPELNRGEAIEGDVIQS